MSQNPPFNPITGFSVAYDNSSEPSQFETETTNIGPLVTINSGDGSFNLLQNANNLPVYTMTLSGNLFAFEATGGYYTAQTFEDINALPETAVQTYDCTGAVEVQLNRSIFNNKLGTYHYDTDIWDNDTLTLTASEFKDGITNANQIVTVGKLSTLYSDFTNYVHLYFGIHPSGPLEGFGTLFAGDFNFNPNNSVFGPTDFFNLINSNVSSISQTTSINQLSGTITLANINQLLRNAVSANPFQNRTPITSNPTSNPGVNDGFLAADLIFIPNNGMNITLNLNVVQEAFPTPLNNYNVNVSGGWIDAAYNTTRDASGEYINTMWDNTSTFVQNTSSTTTLITRTINAPLLIIMV